MINNFSVLFEKHDNISDHLIVLDIDETVLYFEDMHDQWWSDTFAHFYREHRDYDRADEESLKKWKETIVYKEPIPTDPDGLKRLLSEDTNILFLTARDPDFEKVTMGHLKKVGFESPNVIFCGLENKGHVLQKWLVDNAIDKGIIFVDDKEHNVKNVKESVSNAHCYHFKKD